MAEPIAPAAIQPAGHAPRATRLFDPIARRLLVAGVAMGPNALVTIRGRTSGEPRATPLAIVEVGGRRWVWSPWGEVHWVRNLRAAGRATVSARRTSEAVVARELAHEERVAFFRDVLAPYAAEMRFGMAFVRLVDGVDLHHPEREAQGRPVFELLPAEGATPAP